MTRLLALLLIVGTMVVAMVGTAMANPSSKTAAEPVMKAGVLSPVMPAPALALQGTDGQPIDLARYRGKVLLVAFGFSHCAEVCPITLVTLAGARKKLGPDAADVQVVYVTVDPERDTAAHMRKYLANFDPTFVGGVGTQAQIDAAQKDWGISSRKIVQDENNYTIGHSSSVYLVDRKGGLRAVMPYGRSVDDFVHDLRILLGS